MEPVYAGIDIGGTDVKGGFVDALGRVRERFAVRTGDHAGPEGLVAALAAHLRRADSGLDVRGVGVGAPNGNARRGTVEYPPNLPWPGVTPLADLLAEASGLPCVLDNDANAAALGEGVFGAARGIEDFLFITLGTGLGSGLVVKGALVRGHSGFAGEVGHVIVEAGGRLCGCGRRGCLERYCSATGLVLTYRELAPDAPEGVDARAVFERAEAGEAAAAEAFEQTGERLGLALANAVAYTSPAAIFLFGGLVAAGERLFAPTRRAFEANLLPIYRGTVTVRPSGLDDDAGILGAASLVCPPDFAT